ncbi:MAG: hypothetical protein CMC08_06455 [Flavobacteriaceae bacterium]|nr:hypothetical protein [Flavobacteriaceae bacterium]
MANTYKTESHTRSILKGISWRVFATTDTVLVVFAVTCLYGDCSFETAVKIGATEFLVKLFVYYGHERIWQRFQLPDRSSKIITLYKSISWRVVATTMTFLISGAILNQFNEVAISIAFTELITKFALYYVHERLWLRLPLGHIRSVMYGYFRKK